MIKPPKKKRKASSYRYVLTEDGLWNRVTNDEAGRVFLGLVVRPKKSGGTKTKYIPEKYDNSIEAAKKRENYYRYRNSDGQLVGEPGLEIVSPEYDILTLGAGARTNAATQTILRTRKLAGALKKEIDRGLEGATKDMPVFRPEDLYNPDHVRRISKGNIKTLDAKKPVSLDAIDHGLDDGLHAYPLEEGINSVDLIKGSHGHFVKYPLDPSTKPLNVRVPEEPTKRQINKLFVHPLDAGLNDSGVGEKKFDLLNNILKEKEELDKYVDSDGNVNMRNVVKLVKDFYKTHPNAANYKYINNSSGNLYLHTRDVVKSAQSIPVPKGYTRLQLVQAALFHDIGKVFDSGISHGKTALTMLDDAGVQVSPLVRSAISDHMSHHMLEKPQLTRALHFADVARGASWDEAAYKYPHLAYEFDKPKLSIPSVSLKEELKTRINPWLKARGYDTINPNSSEEVAWAELEDRIELHRSFLRGTRDPLKTQNTSPEDIRNAENAIKLLQKERGVSKEFAESDEAARLRAEVSATNVPLDATGSGRSDLFHVLYGNDRLPYHSGSRYSKMIGADAKTQDGLYISTSDDVGNTYGTSSEQSRRYGSVYRVMLPKHERRAGESMSEYLLRNDFDMVDLLNLDGAHRGQISSMFEGPYRLQTGRSLQQDMRNEGLIEKPNFDKIENPKNQLMPGDFPLRGSGISYDDLKGLMDDANKLLESLGINFRFNTTPKGAILRPEDTYALISRINEMNMISRALKRTNMRAVANPAKEFMYENDYESMLGDMARDGAFDVPDELLSILAEQPNVKPQLLGVFIPPSPYEATFTQPLRQNILSWPGGAFLKGLVGKHITRKQYDAAKKAFLYGTEDPNKYIHPDRIINKFINEYLEKGKGKKFPRTSYKLANRASLRIDPKVAADFMRAKGIVPRYEVEGYGDDIVYAIEASLKNNLKNTNPEKIKRTYGYIVGKKGLKVLEIKEDLGVKERRVGSRSSRDSGKQSGRKISRKSLRVVAPLTTGTFAALKNAKENDEK